MTDRIASDIAEARLNHLIDRARRGALLPAEADQFTTGLRDLVRRLEDTEDDRDRVQQAACRTAEALRLNARRLDSVLADRENERAARTAEEKRARTAEARVTELERLLADELTAIGQPQPPTEDEARQMPCSLWLLSNGHAPHRWQPQPGMADVLCPGAPRKAVATQQRPTT